MFLVDAEDRSFALDEPAETRVGAVALLAWSSNASKTSAVAGSRFGSAPAPSSQIDRGVFGMHHRSAAMVLCSVFLAGSASAQDDVATEKAAVAALYEQQAKSWNQGDLVGFTGAYRKGPDLLFIGPDIHKGYSSVLGNFQHLFPSRASMGHLTYSAVEVQPLDKRYITSTASFHLQRTTQGGGDLDGYFMAVLVRTPGGWRIVRDDSTILPKHASAGAPAPSR